MFRSYTLSSELQQKISESRLWEKYPDLQSRPYLWRFDYEDIQKEILFGGYNIQEWVKKYALSLISSWWYWHFVEDWFHHEWGNLFGEKITSFEADITDMALCSGLLLPSIEDNEFEKQEISQFRKYGFFSELDMIMCLSAYRYRKILELKSDQYEWINSRWIRNVITADVHGDTKIFQYDENLPENIISPFWNKVQFCPRKEIGSMSQVHHSHEPAFFATFFRYAFEIGKLDEIMGISGEKFITTSKKLHSYLWNFWDAGSSNHWDFSEMLFRTSIPIWGSSKYRNVHTHWFNTNYNDKENAYYAFQISEEWNLELYNAFTETINMIFYPEDCENLLLWILHQCANGHGRTSKEQIVNLVHFYYSEEFKNQKKEL